MFGSDWPVLTTAMAYRQWLDVVREVVDDLDADARHQVLRTTALTTYRAAEQP
jgi:predicted TIM-barrel fold metal-dependent hydrolase